MSASTGAHTVWVYRWEDNDEFNQAPGNPTDTTDKIFGANETMDTADASNNPERMMRPFQRHAEEIIETQFDGSWSADFVLTNTWWLQFVFGEPDTGTGDHVYETTPHAGTSSAPTPPKSAHLVKEVHHHDGTVEQTVFTGCIAGSIDFEVSVEDTVSVSLDGVYADETTYEDPTTNSPIGEIGSQPSLDYRPMHFGNSTLRMDVNGDGSAETRSLIQDASISLEGNAEMAYELGTRFAVIPQYLAYEPSVDYTQLVTADTSPEERQQMYGASVGSSTASPQESLTDAGIIGELEFDANTATDNQVTIELTSAFPDELTRNNIGDPESALEDDVSRMAANATVTVVSDQATPL